MKILIVYGTTEGQTRKIAEYIKGVLENAGHVVLACDATDYPPDPGNFDAVLIGASIHIHKYQTAVQHYITAHAATLNKMPAAFFSVCLATASGIKEELEEVQKITDEFLAKAGWKPLMISQVAGALKYTQYDFFKRLIMRYISKKEGGDTDTSQDYEYTDWADVGKFVQKFMIKIQ